MLFDGTALTNATNVPKPKVVKLQTRTIFSVSFSEIMMLFFLKLMHIAFVCAHVSGYLGFTLAKQLCSPRRGGGGAELRWLSVLIYLYGHLWWCFLIVSVASWRLTLVLQNKSTWQNITSNSSQLLASTFNLTATLSKKTWNVHQVWTTKQLSTVSRIWLNILWFMKYRNCAVAC